MWVTAGAEGAGSNPRLSRGVRGQFHGPPEAVRRPPRQLDESGQAIGMHVACRIWGAKADRRRNEPHAARAEGSESAEE